MEKACDAGKTAGILGLERVERLRLTDVVDGLIAVFALKGIKTLSAADDCMDQSMQRLFPSIERLAKEQKLNVYFRIHLSPFHGDSLAVQDALLCTTQMGYIAWDSPGNRNMQIRITRSSAEALLSHLPGGKHMYETLAEEFLTYYQDPLFRSGTKVRL